MALTEKRMKILERHVRPTTRQITNNLGIGTVLQYLQFRGADTKILRAYYRSVNYKHGLSGPCYYRIIICDDGNCYIYRMNIHSNPGYNCGWVKTSNQFRFLVETTFFGVKPC